MDDGGLENDWTQAFSHTSPMLPRYTEARPRNNPENEDSSHHTRLKSHTSSTGNIGSSTVASTLGYDQSSLHSGGNDDDEDVGGLPPALVNVSLSQQERAGLSNTAEASGMLNASSPQYTTQGSSAAAMSYARTTMFDPPEIIFDETEGTESDESVPKISEAVSRGLGDASEPEDPSPSDSGSVYEPSQTCKTNGQRTASSVRQAGPKKPTTRSQTRETLASPEEETEQPGDSPSAHSSAVRSSVNQYPGNGSDPGQKPGRNLAHKLYESRAAQKASRETESASTKQKSQKKPARRGKIAKRPFTDTPDQPHDEEATKSSSDAKPGKLPRGKAASRTQTSSDTRRQKDEAIQLPASDDDGDDPYAVDNELQPETPIVQQSKKVSGKSRGRSSTATQQKSVPKRPPGRRQASVLQEPQENSVLEVDDIEDSAMEEVDGRSSVGTRKPKLIDKMKKDGEPAAPSRKQRTRKTKPFVETPKMGELIHEATNQNQSMVQDLTKARKLAKNESRSTGSGNDAAPPKTRGSPNVVHFDRNSGNKPQELETPNTTSKICKTDGESAFNGLAIDEDAHSERDVPASANEQSSTPVVKPAPDSGTPVKKKFPFRKRGGRRRTGTNVSQEDAVLRKDDEQPSEEKRKRATARDDSDDRKSKRVRKSTHAEATIPPAEKQTAIDQPAPQAQNNHQMKASKISSTDEKMLRNPEPPTVVLSDSSMSSSEDLPTPTANKVIHEAEVENQAVRKREDPSPNITVTVKQGGEQHSNVNGHKAPIYSVGSSTSAATLIRPEVPADPKPPGPADSSITSKSYHSAQTSSPPVEIIESPRLTHPFQNHAFKTVPVRSSHGFQGEAVFSQPMPPQNKIQAPASHQDVSHQQQTSIHTRGPMDHSLSQSDHTMPGLERSDNARYKRVQGLHHDDVFPQRHVDLGESAPKFAAQHEVQPKAQKGERPASRVQAKARALDHDDVFSPGIGNSKQKESSFVDELRRKAKARDEAEAALQRQAKARNFTEELMRNPRRPQNDESHGRLDIESADRAQHQRSEGHQALHPHAVAFGQELLRNDKQLAIENQSSDHETKFDSTHGFVPSFPRGGAPGQDPVSSLSRRIHHRQDSSHWTELGNRAVPNETQTIEEMSSLSWQAEIDRAASGLVDTMHDITTALVRQLLSRDDKINDIVEEYKRNGRKIAAGLFQRQQTDLRKVSTVFQKDCREISAAYKAALETTRALQSSLATKRKAVDEVESAKRRRYEHVQRSITAAREALGNTKRIKLGWPGEEKMENI